MSACKEPLSPFLVASKCDLREPVGPYAWPLDRTSVCYRSSESRPVAAGTEGVTATREPVRTHALWLGEKRGASKPSFISRVTAKRSNEVTDRYNRKLSGNPSDAVSGSPSGAEMMPSWLASTRATSAAYASDNRPCRVFTPGSNEAGRA